MINVKAKISIRINLNADKGQGAAACEAACLVLCHSVGFITDSIAQRG